MGQVRIVSTDSEAYLNRREAGEALAAELAVLRGQNPVILAIPRGAVPMGRVVADELGGADMGSYGKNCKYGKTYVTVFAGL